jgi:hypothetical protein
MRPKINVLEGGIAVTREMTEEEYAEYQQMLEMAWEEAQWQ